MADEVKRSTGVVVRFNDGKGFGFITPDDGGEDLFVHQSSIVSEGFRSLSAGERVEFSITVGENQKTKAVDVTGPNRAPLQASKRDNHGGSGGGYYASRVADGHNGGNGGAGCYHCGEVGHLARECNSGNNVSSGRCFKCGGAGHMARNCTRGNGGGGNGGSCYNCGERGHMARDCNAGNSGDGPLCYRCRQSGHMAKDCNQESRRFGGGGGGGDRGNSCFQCGDAGHFARDCPNYA